MYDLETVSQDIDKLEQDPAADVIEQTAVELERYDYTPLLLTDVTGFARYTKATLKQRCREILQADEQKRPAFAEEMSPEAYQDKQIKMLLYQYAHLQRLRRGDPEAWDQVTEVVGDD